MRSIKGHALKYNGLIRIEWRVGTVHRLERIYKGGCECGAKPPDFPSVKRAAMREWHQRHKAEVLGEVVVELCWFCKRPVINRAFVQGHPVCHDDDRDCYRVLTVYGGDWAALARARYRFAVDREAPHIVVQFDEDSTAAWFETLFRSMFDYGGEFVPTKSEMGFGPLPFTFNARPDVKIVYGNLHPFTKEHDDA